MVARFAGLGIKRRSKRLAEAREYKVSASPAKRALRDDCHLLDNASGRLRGCVYCLRRTMDVVCWCEDLQ